MQRVDVAIPRPDEQIAQQYYTMHMHNIFVRGMPYVYMCNFES